MKRRSHKAQVESHPVEFRFSTLGLTLVFCFLLVQNAFADPWHSWFFRTARAEVNGSFFRNRPDEYHLFTETTAGASFGISLLRGLEAGVQSRSVFAQSTRIPSARFFLLGGYVQYDFMINSPHRFYLEASYGGGDYCPCGDLDYRREVVRYAGGAIGFDYSLSQKGNWKAGAALFISKVLGAGPNEGDFNYLRVGVSHTFGKKDREMNSHHREIQHY